MRTILIVLAILLFTQTSNAWCRTDKSHNSNSYKDLRVPKPYHRYHNHHYEYERMRAQYGFLNF